MLLASNMLFASDGVIEINHTCATELGCFSGDAVDYPVLIDGSAGSSYKLTSDLIVPADSGGISVIAQNISLDLNGFSIISAACNTPSATISCRPPTSTDGRDGINLDFGFEGFSVKNGSVIGMGANGILIFGESSTVTNIKARWNANAGIITFSSSIVTRNISTENGHHGIATGPYSIIKDNTVRSNLATGISCTTSSMIINNNVSGYHATGISAGNYSNIRQNTIQVSNVIALDLSATTLNRALYSENYLESTSDEYVQEGTSMGDNLCGNSAC